MLRLRSQRVVLPDGEHPATIDIDGGVIVRIESESHGARSAKASAGREPTSAVDCGHLVISPGMVDTHVHVNEPGRTEWEGFDTATRAAAAGGVTTIVDMPLNSIPATTTVDALEAKRAAARGKVHVDVGFWGGVVPGNEADLEPLVDAGVRGFKCFLVPSGVDEFPAVDETDLRRAMPILARRAVPLLVHAEDPTAIVNPQSPICNPQSPIRNPQSAIRNPKYAAYLSTRPPDAEVAAIRLMIRLAREFGVRTHIVHVAAAEAVVEIEQAKRDGVPITAETCPHYLTFASEEIPDGATAYKCAPPIREARHRAALWAGLESGAIDLIATDHSPAPPELKCPGDFTTAWGGIASLQISLPAVWTAGVRRIQPGDGPALQKLRLQLARWMSERPAALAGLADRKGRIAVGYDADLIVWDPDTEIVVSARWLEHRHKLTPYTGRRLRGGVVTTLLRGEPAARDLDHPGGRLL